MQDETGQFIYRRDFVRLNSPAAGSNRDRGLAVKGMSGPKVVVQCLDGTEVTVNARDVLVADRSCFCPGMVVASASDRGGQLGVVTGAAVELDLVRLDGEDAAAALVARGVSSAELRRVSEFCLGDYVVSGPWLGRVFEVSLDVDVLFDDGAVCRVTTADGKCGPLAWALQNATPTTSSIRGSASAAARPSSRPPGGSRATGSPAMARAPRTRRQESRSRAGFERPLSVASTRTTVDVLWQDGTRQCQAPSVSLVPTKPQKSHEFFPGQRVVSRTSSHGDGDVARSGVVRSLNYTDQTVRMLWQKATAEHADDETLSSTYDLGRDFDSNVFYGDVVVRRRPTDSSIGVAGDICGSTEEPVLTRCRKEEPTRAHDLSWVGHIVDFCDAHHVQVKWGDGNTSKVSFHEITVVKEQSFSEFLQEIGEWVSEDGGMSNDAIDHKAQVTAAAIDNNNDGEGDDDSDSDDGQATMRMMDQVGLVVQAVIRLAGEVLAQGRRYLVNGWTVTGESTSELTARGNNNVSAPVSGGDGDAKETSIAVAGINGGGGGEGKEAEADATGDDKPFSFPQFEIVQSPSDHHYLGNMEQGTGGGRKWTKRVQKEWNILENNLPDTIFMRAYEDRMDLLRAVMVGASGTPYHDGLFFFDLQLPPSYPAAPPLVYYRSFGLHVNPNLDPSGTVCLSLLNTFGGHGAELWSPEASTVLQVVVSIQGLVLNAQPYYNEAGYAVQVGTPQGRRNELPYNENTYLRTLQTMLHLLRRPPAGFEEFVRDHFHRRGQHVLRACEAYLDGCLVGTLDGEGSGARRPCSAGFRLALAKVVPRLVEAFTAIDADGCKEFDRLRVRTLCT
ncbi:LOW QUALITY PROTEIN: probable ubiquitin-conjugating enzyme E2 23 [Setaria italica]|uniref:LOW QUALITY PROTEIN: probable ubiquitin-conjugating enzyme E2 23 n=1 Tax=Setaria italica TaxID=4555 RepID=UPI000BE4FE6E|nr:LOW QUALITY PROTEIN: probable ubiquitin-conjugating enzyme E2 23 [Setaria italica]